MTPILTKPRKVYRKLIDLAFFWSAFLPRKNNKPGALISQLSEKEREQLKDLKSDDVKNDWIQL